MIKRLLDISLSLMLLTIISPVILAIVISVLLFLGSPVLFCQLRPGRNGKLFLLCKFRTMTNDHDSAGNLLQDGQRLTTFGRFLRSTSLDELPELWNVVKGDMSLVGPRPLLMEYLSRYTPQQARRHEVRPGITGWAQVNGRNALSWEERFKLDVWYVDNQCVSLDFKILLLTIVKVFQREGIAKNGHDTMTKFMGSEKDG